MVDLCTHSSTKHPKANLKAWLLASRPKTLSVSFVPVLVGTVLAQSVTLHINWGITVLAFLASLCIQIGTNLINDALDFKKGADTKERLGPQRVTQGGLLSFKQVYQAGLVALALGIFFGIPLMFIGGFPLLFIICLSAACGYLYTGGPFPLAYYGLSDLFIFVFFGLVSTGAVYYLQTGTVDFFCLLAAAQIGLLAIVPNAINNLRDHVSDGSANKRTLAVRFGVTFARYEITVCTFFPFILGVAWLLYEQWLMTLVPLFCLPLALYNVHEVWHTDPSPLYNRFLALSAQTQLIFALLLVLGYQMQ